MRPVDVLDDPGAAASALDPLRSEILTLLAAGPSSAAGLAPRLGISRQKVRYHLQALATHGLVDEAGTRRHGGLTERLYEASASSYVVSPAAMGDAGADPSRVADRLSAAYLVSLAARAVREVGALARRAGGAGTQLPTLSIDTEIRFADATSRAAFTEELQQAVLDLAGRYHDERTRGGRPHRLVVLAHPTPTDPRSAEESP